MNQNSNDGAGPGSEKERNVQTMTVGHEKDTLGIFSGAEKRGRPKGPGKKMSRNGPAGEGKEKGTH